MGWVGRSGALHWSGWGWMALEPSKQTGSGCPDKAITIIAVHTCAYNCKLQADDMHAYISTAALVRLVEGHSSKWNRKDWDWYWASRIPRGSWIANSFAISCRTICMTSIPTLMSYPRPVEVVVVYWPDSHTELGIILIIFIICIIFTPFPLFTQLLAIWMVASSLADHKDWLEQDQSWLFSDAALALGNGIKGQTDRITNIQITKTQICHLFIARNYL